MPMLIRPSPLKKNERGSSAQDAIRDECTKWFRSAVVKAKVPIPLIKINAELSLIKYPSERDARFAVSWGQHRKKGCADASPSRAAACCCM